MDWLDELVKTSKKYVGAFQFYRKKQTFKFVGQFNITEKQHENLKTVSLTAKKTDLTFDSKFPIVFLF
jgi:hypothetical protein